MSTTTWSLPTWMTLPLTMSPSLTSSCLSDSSNSAAKLSSWLLFSVAIETMRYSSAFRPLRSTLVRRSPGDFLVPRLARGFGLSRRGRPDHSGPAKVAEISVAARESQRRGSGGAGPEGVAIGDPAARHPAPEPAHALRGRAVRERLRDDPCPRAAFCSVSSPIAAAARQPLLDVAGLEQLPVAVGVERPDAGEAVGLQLDRAPTARCPRRRGSRLRWSCTRSEMPSRFCTWWPTSWAITYACAKSPGRAEAPVELGEERRGRGTPAGRAGSRTARPRRRRSRRRTARRR